MAMCPKCKQPVADNISSCPACGQSMPAKQTGTLDVSQHYEKESTPSQTPAALQPVPQRPDQPSQAANAAMGTLDMPDIQGLPIQPATPEKTQVDVDATLDSIEIPADRDGTVVFPNAHSVAPAPGTVQYDAKDLNDAKSGSLRSGTAGRLKRLWQGAAGSSANPMHTLKGNDALATDSVFAKVAKRVLVTDTSINIAESVGTASASQPDRKTRVEQCIASACRGAEDETADYDLTGFLGQGGMGVVLKARQRAIGRDVAIKMIQPSAGQSISSTNSQKKKFFYEAQITGKLDHPNIVPIYELGVCNDILFYSMKMIIGTEWKDVIQKNSRDENLDILMKVADAMAFAHQRHIIHRDLKPENVMLGPFGEVLVTDWGCAIDLSRKESFTGAGSPPWMAPEMADHNLQLIGSRSDIYLLGAILYQVIAGYPPHPGQTVFECIEAAQKNIILPLQIEDPLLDIAYRAMEKNPEDRYQSVEAMQDAIRQYRRHAESITLTERSEALLVQAVASKDYERFSRTIFGFQDAIELWPDNKVAQVGSAKARLAYGQCAYDKTDYDLCLSTLNPNVPLEAELYHKAAKAKKIAEEREGRFKTLRKAFAAVVLLGLGVSSVLAIIAWSQKSLAEKNLATAETAKAAETEAKELAVRREGEARKAQVGEAEQRKQAEQSANDALLAKKAAEMAQSVAEEERAMAVKAKEAEELAKQAAIDSEGLAVAAQGRAEAAQKVAEKRTAEVELVNYQSKVSLYDRQVKQSDVRNANAALQDLLNTASYEALTQQGRLPKFENWALNRVRLLSNSELRSQQALGNVTAISFADDANRGCVATLVSGEPGLPATGSLHIVELVQKKLKVVLSLPTAAPVASVSISPDGDELVYSLVTGANDSTIFRQSLKENAPPATVVRSDNASSLAPAATMQAFAMTEQRVVGGINGGLWVWSRDNSNWQDFPPKQISSIRGRMRSLQMLSDDQALVLAELNGQLFVHRVNLSQGTAERIQVNAVPGSDFDKQETSAVAFSNGKLVIGTELGKLYSVDMPAAASEVGPEFREILPQQHRSKIASIRAHEDGTLLTTAAEPVVHVWSISQQQLSGWQYNTVLAGTPENVGGVAFMNSSGLILGVGEEGNAIVWDVTRQKQRQRLEQLTPQGHAMEYDAPVIQVVTSKDNRRAVSIRANGKIETWDMVSGRTIHQSMAPNLPASSTNFIGHSPGAEFVDMAIDARSGRLVTSARLPTDELAAEGSLTDAQATEAGLELNWEFCKWDTSTGKMLDRWTRPAAIEQEVALAEGGELILYSNNVQTLVQEAKRDGATRFFTDKLGSSFAVPHPLSTNLLMTVKTSGATRVLDTQREAGGWNLPGFRINYQLPEYSSLLSDDDVPLTGAWNPSGNRFYLVWASGRITEFSWENEQLAMKRDLRAEQLDALGIAFRAGGFVSTTTETSNVRLTSRWQLDLKVRSLGDSNLLYMAVRFPGIEGRTRLVRLTLPRGDTPPTAVKDEQLFKERLLLSDDAEPVLLWEPIASLPTAMSSQIVASRRVGNSNYFALTNGTVLRVSEQGLMTFGAPPTLSASGNAAADRIVTLHEGGSMWLAEAHDERWVWTPLAAAPATANNVSMSPDGAELLVTCTEADGQSQLLRMDALTGKTTETITQIQCGAWHENSQLALVTRDGQVLLKVANGQQVVGQLEGGTAARSVHHFIEPWSDANLPATHWLVVHSQATHSIEGSELEFFNLTPQPIGEAIVRHRTPLASGIAVLACSPTDGIFVTGGGGTVSVHFASPSLEQYGPSPLFSLEGHAGAEIECLAFSPDGRTLISTDNNNRLFGWMSADPLEGITTGLSERVVDSVQ